MKELETILNNINQAIPLTKQLFKAHMEGLGAWQDLVEDKNSIKGNVSAQISLFFSHRAALPARAFFFSSRIRGKQRVRPGTAAQTCLNLCVPCTIEF